MRLFLTGKAGSGKSTMAEYLCKKYNFVPLKIAEPMYYLAHEFFNMINKDRPLLQKIGNGFRAIDNDVWINHLIKELNKIDNNINIVIDDCRFLNEFTKLKEKGFKGVYISCDDKIRYERLKSRDGVIHTESLNDKSETEMDSFKSLCDKEVDGSCNIEDFHKSINKLIHELVINE